MLLDISGYNALPLHYIVTQSQGKKESLHHRKKEGYMARKTDSKFSGQLPTVRVSESMNEKIDAMVLAKRKDDRNPSYRKADALRFLLTLGLEKYQAQRAEMQAA